MSSGFDLEIVKAVLQTANEDGYSVYEHTCNIVAKSLDEKKAVPAEKLPDYSKDVKAHRFQVKPAVQQHGNRGPDARDVARAKETRLLFERPAPKVSTTIERPQPTVTVTTTETVSKSSLEPRPLSADIRMHRMCGIGLPRHEYFLLEQSITKLTQEKGLQDVRFVGKIFGTQANYIVVLSRRWFEDPATKIWQEKYEMPKPPRKHLEVPVQPEPAGIGLNRVTFWVCAHAGAPWTPLPDVTPQQINAARRSKKYFTGNLDADINSYPMFPGTERNLLRAQLARIIAATEISPEGEREPYEAEDDEPEEEEDPKAPKEEKFKPLTNPAKPVSVEDEGIASFASREKWQHCQPYLFRTGRATKLPEKPEPEEGEEPEPEDDEEEEKEEDKPEEVEFLRAVGQDQKYAQIKQPPEPKQDDGEEEGEGGGDEKPEEDEEEEEEDKDAEEGEGEEDTEGVLFPWVPKVANKLYKKHGVVVMRSLRWPGAYAWLGGVGGQVSGCAYFGDGLKATDAAFRPFEAPRVQGEPEDLQEIADPTSMTEKLVLRGEEPREADSEDDKDDEEEEGEEGA